LKFNASDHVIKKADKEVRRGNEIDKDKVGKTEEFYWKKANTLNFLGHLSIYKYSGLGCLRGGLRPLAGLWCLKDDRG
jgi:hypothetical protein